VLTRGPISFIFLRFSPGLAEAGFFPGMILHFNYWFPPLRAAPMSRGTRSSASGWGLDRRRSGPRRWDNCSRHINDFIVMSGGVSLACRATVDDDWRRVGHVGAPFSSLFSLGGL
jgi:hypothetical protein